MSSSAPAGLAYPIEQPPEPGAWLEIAPGVFWIRIPLPFVIDHVNVYVLDDGDGWTLVDTGIFSGDVRRMWCRFLDGPMSGRPVHRIVLTHHHPDHAGSAGWFKREFGSEIFSSRTAWLMARMLQLDVHDTPSPEMVAFWQGAGVHGEALEQRCRERPFNSADAVHAIPLGFTRLKEGDRLAAAGRDWEVRLCGGHAPDHATLWSDADDLVLVGDQVLATISPNVGVYATEPRANPLGDWLESCSRLAACAREAHLALPGHGMPFRGLPFRLKQLIAHHDAALDRIRGFLATPKTMVECFSPLYGRALRKSEFGLALAEAAGHINYLLDRGEIRAEHNGAGTWRYRLI